MPFPLLFRGGVVAFPFLVGLLLETGMIVGPEPEVLDRAPLAAVFEFALLLRVLVVTVVTGDCRLDCCCWCCCCLGDVGTGSGFERASLEACVGDPALVLIGEPGVDLGWSPRSRRSFLGDVAMVSLGGEEGLDANSFLVGSDMDGFSPDRPKSGLSYMVDSSEKRSSDALGLPSLLPVLGLLLLLLLLLSLTSCCDRLL